MARTLNLALVQMRGHEAKASAQEAAATAIRQAASDGAQVICLPELFHTRYFCRTQETALFDLAEPIPGPATAALAPVARETGTVVIVPIFEKQQAGLYYNSVAVLGPDGELLGRYRKHHIPQDPGFEEKFYFTPGDGGYPVWETPWGKIGVLICWDQWYPEAARLMALAGAEVIVYPTAIGWLPDEKAALGAAQHHAWRTVQCGHAVANGSYVAAVNRVGTEGDTEFWGRSFVSDYYGQVVAEAGVASEEIVHHRCDLTALEDFRRIWPFFRDRRIETYGDLLKRQR